MLHHSALPSRFGNTATQMAPALNVSSLRLPRILFVTDSADPSGIGAHMLALATCLKKHAELRLIFARVGAALPWMRRAVQSGVRVNALAPAQLTRGGQTLISLLHSLRPDIVHVHAGIAWEGHGCTQAAKEAGISAVVRTEHLPYTLRPLRAPDLEMSYAQNAVNADRIICVSDAARATFRMSAVRPTLYQTIHNGICPSVPTRARTATRALLRLHDEPLILTVARLTEQKQHTVLLQAMRRVLRACTDAHLLIVGDGPLDLTLKTLARQTGISHRVHFLGRREDVPELLAASDLFCLPSHFEGHPLALMEAMAAGIPVVATRSLGITETVINGETGVLVPTRDPVALGAALIRVLSDKALALRLRQSAIHVASTEFSAERMAASTLALYQRCIQERFASINC